jgi:MerR family transcriptional regulator, light-induced transcriptional regulator
MGKYSIRELERLSGIKAHTIRIWEKRFQLVEPQRTTANIRYYTDDDLKKIINVSLLNNHGIKISHIAGMSYSDICQKVLEVTERKDESTVHINRFIVSMVEMDEEEFNSLLSRLTEKMGLERVIAEIVYPFLDRIGILWQTGNITPAQEHFMSNLLRQKMIVAIDALPIPPKNARRAVLFLPEPELHEIGLLFTCYLVKKEGIRTLYLGQMVPYDDVRAVGAEHKPHYFITAMLSERRPGEIQKYINQLSSDFPSSTIIASGAAINKIALTFPSNFHLLDKVIKIKDVLRA